MDTRLPPEWAIRTRADREALAAGCYWDQANADRLTNFAVKYVKPAAAEDFKLIQWQYRLLQSLWGWKNPDGSRRFRRAVVHCAKKSGKTFICSVLTLAELFISPERSPLAVSLSTSRDNAGQVFKEIWASIRAVPALADKCKDKSGSLITEHKKRIRTVKGSEYFAAAADATTGRGFNCSLVVCDEAGWHRSRGPWDQFSNATAARANALAIIISTAGEMDGWYFGEYLRAKRILSGEDGDQITYCEVYEADQDGPDGWLEDPKQWKKACPSLDEYGGYTTRVFGQELAAAKGDAASWLNFRRDRLNLWLKASAEDWLDPNRWLAGKRPEPADLAQHPVWLGYDGAQRIDPTSVTACWKLPDGRYWFQSWAWVARAGVLDREKQLLRKYDEFPAVTITDGDAQDPEAIKKHLLWLCNTYKVQAIACDQYNAIQLMTDVQTATGVETFRFPQNFKTYNDPCKQFERLLNEGKLHHDGNSWLAWCIGNIRLAQDKWGNVQPDKGRSVDKTDGAIAAIMAFALASAGTSQPVEECVYNTKPVYTFSRY